MTVVDLDKIGLDTHHRILAMNWCYETYGTTVDGRWNLRDLRYVDFQSSKDATFFILKWS
jgi:hypothetical protein